MSAIDTFIVFAFGFLLGAMCQEWADERDAAGERK